MKTILYILECLIAVLMCGLGAEPEHTMLTTGKQMSGKDIVIGCGIIFGVEIIVFGSVFLSRYFKNRKKKKLLTIKTDKELREKVEATFEFGKIPPLVMLVSLAVVALVCFCAITILFIIKVKWKLFVILFLIALMAVCIVVFCLLKHQTNTVKEWMSDVISAPMEIESIAEEKNRGKIRVTFQYNETLYRRLFSPTKKTLRNFKNYIGKTVDGYFSPTYNEVMIARQDMVKK